MAANELTRLQGALAIASFSAGVAIACVCLFLIHPHGEISNSAISIVSELLVLAGAILGSAAWFIGLQVFDEVTGAELGTLNEVLDLPSSTVYVVKGKREILIPAVPEFISRISEEDGIIEVRLIDGLM